MNVSGSTIPLFATNYIVAIQLVLLIKPVFIVCVICCAIIICMGSVKVNSNTDA